MSKIISLFCVFVFSVYFAFSQTKDSTIIGTALTTSELIFKDSIIVLNEYNELFSSSRKQYNSGLEFFNDRNLDSAVVSFTNAVVIDSTFSQAYFYRAKCYDKSDIDLAILDYNMAFKFDSTNLLPIYCIAKIQSVIDVDEAFNTYD